MCASRVQAFLNSSRIAIVFLPFFVLAPQLSPAQPPAGPDPRGEQAPAASATPNPSGTADLNTTVDEVSLDLTVRTKHNKPVPDLKPLELAVTDGGSPVQISSLREVASSAGSEHLVALVFDRLDPGAAKTARKMAEKILAVFPEKGYTFAVFQVSGRLHLLQPYTQDRQLVDTAVVEATPAVPAAPTGELTPAEKTLIASLNSDALTISSDDRARGRLILQALVQAQRILEDRRSFPSLAALQGLVMSDRLLTGRKFIVYFSRGFSANNDARDILSSIAGTANRAGVTICTEDTDPIDPQMVSAMQASMAMSTLGKGGAIGTGGTIGVSNQTGASGMTPAPQLGPMIERNTTSFQYGTMDVDESPLAPLASGTGGIYIRAASGYKRQLQRLHEDLTSWYQASWTPPIKSYDGQFRPIVVRSLRKGLVIRARSGYFAVPPTEGLGIRPFEMPLLNILAGSALPTDIKYHAAVLHLGELPDGNSGELTVQVPVSQLEVQEDSSTHISSAHAAIVAVIKDSKGAVLERFGEDFPLHEAPDMLRLDSGQTITLEGNFSADAGTYTLETAVMDRFANKAGAERTTFTIEAPPKGPALSDIALVERVEPSEEESQSFDPMRSGNGRVVPNLDSDLKEGTRAVSVFFLAHPAAGSQNQPALRMQILRGGKLITEMPMELMKVSGTGAAIPYLGTIHGRVIPAGDYQIKVLLSQDGSTATSSVSFHVEGDMADANSSDVSLTATGSSSSDGIDTRLVSDAATANSAFDVESPTKAVAPPTDAEMQAMIEGARQRALAWTDSLVNFFCMEVTNHSEDATGHGDWKPKGTLVQLMRYVDHQESRTTLILNGDRSNAQPDQLKFAHSAGEFGAMFHIIFDPAAKTVFTWKQAASLDGQPVQVFAFKVARANSGFDLSDRANHALAAGFHGLLYLDPATLSVRRISIDADDIPKELLIRASSMSVDYAWIAMQNHDFLLPVRGAVSLQETKRRPVLNEFEFRGYRRFGSESRVLTDEEMKHLGKN